MEERGNKKRKEKEGKMVVDTINGKSSRHSPSLLDVATETFLETPRKTTFGYWRTSYMPLQCFGSFHMRLHVLHVQAFFSPSINFGLLLYTNPINQF
jgi:hypothetical protein